MVRRIGEVLSLEAERGSPVEPVACEIEVVAGVELDAWFRGCDVEGAAARRVDCARGAPDAGARGGDGLLAVPHDRVVEHEVVVVTVAAPELFLVRIDPRANRGRRA